MAQQEIYPNTSGRREDERVEVIGDAYPQSERVKAVLFYGPVSPARGVEVMVAAWQRAAELYSNPLAQVRIISPRDREEELVSTMEAIGKSLQEEPLRAEVVGRIPFVVEGQPFGIYYLQIESPHRRPYRGERHLNHLEAVARGLERRSKPVQPHPGNGFTLRALEFRDGGAVDILSGRELNEDQTTLAEEIAQLHRLTFETAHDPAQQDPNAVHEILGHNPVLIARNGSGELASVGILERDGRFRLGGIALVEPTYFTHPGDAYRRHGLSSHLRRAALALAQPGVTVSVYNEGPMLIFNESVRASSFVLALANGCELAGTTDGRISGNLGDAYVNIGPANSTAGYMPMGVTYYADPRIAYAD